MKTAWLRVFAELNDHLPRHRRQQWLAHAFAGRTSVKDAIDALGVPHGEIDLIIVNGESVGFSHLVDDGDRIAVYPVFEALDVQTLTRLRPAPLRVMRFVLDGHLGRLAAYLRLAGFDATYQNNVEDEELARTSVQERRILLTRDRALLERGAITHGYWVRAIHPREQLREVARRFDLSGLLNPCTRCARCNVPLQEASPEAVAERVPPRVRDAFDAFRMCTACGRVYWQGSHHARLLRILEQLSRSTTSRPSHRLPRLGYARPAAGPHRCQSMAGDQ